jgi:hypothetical protein
MQTEKQITIVFIAIVPKRLDSKEISHQRRRECDKKAEMRISVI